MESSLLVVQRVWIGLRHYKKQKIYIFSQSTIASASRSLCLASMLFLSEVNRFFFWFFFSLFVQGCRCVILLHF